MSILSLLAKITLDKSGFDAGITAAGKSVTAFGKQLASSFGAAAVAASVSGLIRSSIKYADEMQELSERLETSIKLSQEWALAAKLNGEGADFVAQNFQKMEKAINAANLGDAGSIRSLKALGISMEEIKTIGIEDAMRRAAEALQQSGNAAEKSAAAIDIFNRSANKMRVVAQDLGTAGKLSFLFPSDAEVRNVKEAADALDTIGTLFKGQAIKAISPGGIFSSISPVLSGMFGGAINRAIAGKGKSKEDAAAGAEAFRRIERMRKVGEEIANLQLKLEDAGLTDEQKRVKLTEERLRIMQQIADVEAAGPQNPEMRQKLILDLLKNELDLTKIIEALDVAGPSTKKQAALQGFGIQQTALGAIGGGLPGTSVKNEVRETNRLLKVIADLADRRGIVVKAWR